MAQDLHSSAKRTHQLQSKETHSVPAYDTLQRCVLPLSEMASSGAIVPHVEENAQGDSSHPLQVVRHNRDSATCSWTISPFTVGKLGKRTLWSQYFSIGNYDWRLLVYPMGKIRLEGHSCMLAAVSLLPLA